MENASQAKYTVCGREKEEEIKEDSDDKRIKRAGSLVTHLEYSMSLQYPRFISVHLAVRKTVL